jgi:hypothetical protein
MKSRFLPNRPGDCRFLVVLEMRASAAGNGSPKQERSQAGCPIVARSGEAITMPRQTKLGPYDEEIVEPIDLDEARSELLCDGAHGACAADQPGEEEADLLPGQPLPAFLFGDDDEPQPPAEAVPHTPVMRRRVLQATMLAAAGIAIVFAILSRDYPLDLFANAKASLPAQPASPPKAVPSRAIQSAAGDPRLSTSATGAPTRDEIAAALRGAYQGVNTPARQAETRRPDADPEALLKRFQAWGAEHSTQAGPAPR